jgi:hypothetical protein
MGYISRYRAMEIAFMQGQNLETRKHVDLVNPIPYRTEVHVIHD